MENLSKKVLPQGFSYEWTGLSLEELSSGRTTILLFGLGTLVVYLTLSAQYESFVLPFIVLLAVPMALLGALSQWTLRGLQNDVYCQIGLVMLVGLSSKNAILIVEFAEQLREQGMPLIEATVEGARIRLRPILMTSFAFILGVVPLMVLPARARRPPLGWHHRLWRDDYVHRAQSLLHSCALFDYRRMARGRRILSASRHVGRAL